MGAEHIAIVSRAATERLTVQLAYRDAKGDSTTRRVDVQWHSAEYFGGHCHLRGAQRSFRLDRVNELSVVGQHHRPPIEPPDEIEFWRRAAEGHHGWSTSERDQPKAAPAPIPGWVWWIVIIGVVLLVAILG